MPVTVRLLALLVLSGALAAAGSSATTPPTVPAVVSAAAYGISVNVPGQPGVGAASASAPDGAATGVADGFAYPADGTAARTGAESSSVSAKGATAFAVTDVLAISLLNGEITADSVAGRAKASAAGADTIGSAVTNLVVLGQPVAPAVNGRFPLADWGYVVTLEQVIESSVTEDTRNARAAVTALRVVLTADHGGLPAGAEILVGHAEASAATPVAPIPPPGGTKPVKPAPKPGRPAGVPPKKAKPLPKPPEPRSRQARLGFPAAAHRRVGSAVSGRLRLSGLRALVVHGHVPSGPGRRRLAPRRGHLRPARRAAARRRRRHRLLGRLERPGRLPVLVARPAGEPVLLRPPLRLLAARRRRERGQGRRRDRLRRQHRRRADDPVPPALRDPPGRPPADGLRRRRQRLPVPERVAPAPGHLLRGRPGLGSARAGDGDGAAARRRPARLDRHLERERPRAGLARARAHRPGVSRGRRRARSRAVSSSSSRATTACTRSRPRSRR